MGTKRKTDAIINNTGYVHVACSEEVSWPVCTKFKQVCVSKLLSAKKEVMEVTLFFMCLIDMNKFLRNIYDL